MPIYIAANIADIAANFPHIRPTFFGYCSCSRIPTGLSLTFANHIHCLCRATANTSRASSAPSLARLLRLLRTATLVHFFVDARFDYCSTLYAGVLAGRLGCPDRDMRTAAPHVPGYMLDVLCWLFTCAIFAIGYHAARGGNLHPLRAWNGGCAPVLP